MNFDWSKYNGDQAWLSSHTILLTLTGSHAYGLAIEGSDYDWRGVAIPPREYFTGFLHRFEQSDRGFTEIDCSIFDIRKFFALAADANPNIIEILWTDIADTHICTPAGLALKSIRDGFLSRKVKHTFSGYAVTQLKRINTHRKWLLDPPNHKPSRSEFDLPETALLAKDHMGAIEAITKDETHNYEDCKWFGCAYHSDLSANVMHIYQRERAYHNALTQWHQYENWKKTRNQERAELERKFGYDAKHAMHLVRLMRMGAEILSTGEVNVKRPDREELLEIRGGAWSYDRIVGYAEEMDAKLTELERASHLPHSPNRAWLDGACQQIVEEFHKWR